MYAVGALSGHVNTRVLVSSYTALAPSSREGQPRRDGKELIFVTPYEVELLTTGTREMGLYLRLRQPTSLIWHTPMRTSFTILVR